MNTGQLSIAITKCLTYYESKVLDFSEIRDEDKDMFHELCAAYINNGKSLSQPSNKSQAKDIGNRPKSQPIVKLRDSQKMLLKGTTPGVYM